MKRWSLRIVIAILVVAAGLVGVLYATGRIGHPHDDSTVTLYGNVEIREVDLGFRLAGRLETMRFEEGQQVTAGAAMAELELRPFEDQVKIAEAQVAVQDAILKKLVGGARPAELSRARAAVDDAAAAAQNARTSLERSTKLIAQGAITGAAHDEIVAASRSADARLAGAKDSYRLLAQGNRVEDIAAAQAQVEVARAQLAAAQTALDDAHLVAPADGVVTSRVHEPGAIISPNDVVYVLSLSHSVWVRTYVSEIQLGSVHPGMQVSVFSDAGGTRAIRGHIGFISPTAEFTPKSVETPELRTSLVYRMRVIVDEPGPDLRQGMPVTVKLSIGSE
ncbi:MAG: efflux RND transporter periplasmic adaptor subunit [Kofleriaceae bacterium]